MTPQEAISRCEFWTTNVSETQAIGSSTNQEIAALFGCNVSTPRCYWSDPTGPRHWDIRVRRWLTERVEATGEKLRIENPLWLMVLDEIERRKAVTVTG